MPGPFGTLHPCLCQCRWSTQRYAPPRFWVLAGSREGKCGTGKAVHGTICEVWCWFEFLSLIIPVLLFDVLTFLLIFFLRQGIPNHVLSHVAYLCRWITWNPFPFHLFVTPHSIYFLRYSCEASIRTFGSTLSWLCFESGFYWKSGAVCNWFQAFPPDRSFSELWATIWRYADEWRDVEQWKSCHAGVWERDTLQKADLLKTKGRVMEGTGCDKSRGKGGG